MTTGMTGEIAGMVSIDCRSVRVARRGGASRWAAFFAGLVLAAAMPPAVVFAQDAAPEKKEQSAAEKRKAAKLAREKGDNFSDRNIKKIQKMIELQEKGDIAGAKAILEGINLAREKPYGRARILQFLGAFAVQEEQFDKALDYLARAIKEEGLPEEEQLRTMFQVGQIQVMQERYDDAIVTLENWIKLTTAPESVTKPTAQAYYTLAVTYYQAGRAKEALAPAKKAVEMSTDPQESWYRLLLALYLETENFDAGVDLLDEIILKYPNKTYWTQLAAIYNQKDQMNKSLAVQQLAQIEGYIDEEKDLLRMAQMSMVQGIPHRGAEIMRKGLEDGTIKPSKTVYQTYSDTLLQSREWALALDPLQKAAELSEDGAMWVRHAQVNLQLGRWADARESLNKAFQKGKIPDEGQAHVLFGIAAANDKQWDAATAAFNRAGKFPGTADVAVKWLAFVDREKFRFATPEQQQKMAEERAKREAEAAAKEATEAPAGSDAAAKAGATTQASAGQAANASGAGATGASAADSGAAKPSAKN